MLKLKFSNSNIFSYKLVEGVQGKKYLMDLSSVRPKSVIWGGLPDTVSVTAYELEKESVQFELKNKTSNGLKAGIIVALQPLLYTLYNLLHSLFVSYNISQQLGIKTLLFAISMLISYLMVISFLNFNKKKVKDRLGKKRSVQTFVFKPTKRIYDGYFIFIISLVCYIVYLSINNGSEGALLIVNTVLSMLCFAYTNSAIPVAEYYQTEIYLLKNIKSNEEIK
ncbi:DUF443 family protein [uncultured Granulicatella sp.]|uniref:DUF443 family protein n=1 Tax=uncultured Granulicatella sp. TaxID=316089 RepID=UPI0028D9061E|nr:DUF443 family protein [uncultured Granulicatella sp.]